MNRSLVLALAWLSLLALTTSTPSPAQPQPGDLFREYTWLPTMVAERAKFLRVGGRLDYQTTPDHFPPELHQDGHIPIDHEFDLEGAIRAEVVLEFVQSHEDTKGLAIQINRSEWLTVPPLAGVPNPQSDYMIHAFPVVPIPLAHFLSDARNTFKLQVDTTQRWNWPQNLFYGLIFRIYYGPEKASRDARIGGLATGQALDENQRLALQTSYPSAIERVEYIGRFEDFNWEGDGRYRQWHYTFFRGRLNNHIGTAREAPFRATWSTDWLPDQSTGIRAAARVVYRDSLIYFTPSVDSLRLERDYSIELARPYRQPANWVTRIDSLTAFVALHGPVGQAEAMQVAWRSWSPCYARGVFINHVAVFDRSDPCYDYAEHLIEIERPGFLRPGENPISTGKTPLVDGEMVHGMEVQWPGIAVKVRYPEKPDPGIRMEEGLYAGRPHFIVHTPAAVYYLDRAGGGLSRIIDREGNDWVGFWPEPRDEYPGSAAASYRGLPNLVFRSDDSGAGHPGHEQSASEITGDAVIQSTSLSGAWQWQWRFSVDQVRLEVQRVDPDHPYWMLYEGTPGGVFDPAGQYFGADTGGPRSEPSDYFNGTALYENWRWFYAGHKEVPRVLFLLQLEPDTLTDTVSYLGNREAGIESPDGMVVFGFGRADGAMPLLREPRTFVIGFWEEPILTEANHRNLQDYIETLAR